MTHWNDGAWLKTVWLTTAVALAGAAEAETVPALKDVFNGRFDIGVAVGALPGNYQPEELALLRRHFGIVTPENDMKLHHVQRGEGRFNFEKPDAFVAFAESNQLKIVGHNLFWMRDDETPGWFFKDGDEPAGRELILKRMREHIRAVAGRYRGRITCWDVANEALSDGDEFLRPSKWQSLVGDDVVEQAFRFAHEADPQARLVYNDYSIESPDKRPKLLRLLREFKARGAPIHVVGIQGHWELDCVPFRDIEETIEAVSKLGVKVAITELDLGVVRRGQWWADGGKHQAELKKLNPYADGCPPDVLRRQAEQYGRLFQLLLKHADAVERVTFWGLHDGRSWLNDWPWKRADHGLIFDRRFQPKPAFFAITAATRPGAPR
ncbi:MAG: endo-1,4-beta-xylanase [Verrucomicrobiia bacterium]